jgi:hypothetical protein
MSIIAAGTTTTTALSSTGNTDGTIQLQVNGTTPSVTLNTLGAVGVGASPNFGTSGQVLISGGSTTAPTWGTAGAATTATNLAGGAASQIPYQTGSGSTAFIANGTTGQVLTSNGASAPTWTSPSSGGFTAKTANYTAVSGDNILANTNAGSWILTLPASPATGAAVQVMDSVGTFGRAPLTVARNGSTIMNLAEDMIMAVNGAATTFVYNGSTWRVI